MPASLSASYPIRDVKLQSTDCSVMKSNIQLVLLHHGTANNSPRVPAPSNEASKISPIHLLADLVLKH